MRFCGLLVAPSVLLLAGCGGDSRGGCATTADLRPDPTYVGFYEAIYTPRGSAIGGSLDFILNVAEDGTVTGHVHNPSIDPEIDADVTGTVLNTPNACGTGLTSIDLRYAFTGSQPQTLSARRSTGKTLGATYSAEGTTDGGGPTSGSLKVEPIAVTE